MYISIKILLSEKYRTILVIHKSTKKVCKYFITFILHKNSTIKYRSLCKHQYKPALYDTYMKHYT